VTATPAGSPDHGEPELVLAADPSEGPTSYADPVDIIMMDESGLSVAGTGALNRSRDRVPDFSIAAADTSLRRWAQTGVVYGLVSTGGVHWLAELPSEPSLAIGLGVFAIFTVIGAISNLSRRHHARKGRARR
jgi:hypothetical protein